MFLFLAWLIIAIVAIGLSSAFLAALCRGQEGAEMILLVLVLGTIVWAAFYLLFHYKFLLHLTIL